MKIEMNSIGTFEDLNQSRSYELPVQPDENLRIGIIHLNKKSQFELALQDLNSFSHIWVLFFFHEARSWKPLVWSRRYKEKKRGVFSTRAPYRPNSIGMSAVKLLKIEGLKIYVQGADILNDSPILDIKPYLKYSDFIPDSNEGWLGQIQKWNICYSLSLNKKVQYLNSQNIKLDEFVQYNLTYEPMDRRHHRFFDERANPVIGYGTWRIELIPNEQKKVILIKDVYSGYRYDELLDLLKDPYFDKKVHLKFNELFKTNAQNG